VLDRNYLKRYSDRVPPTIEEILEEDIPEKELSDGEVAILFLICVAFVTVVIVLPIVLSIPPKG